MKSDDNDVIRGLGLVTLYAAYLEEQIDSLRAMVGEIEKIDNREQWWPISKRIEKVRQILVSVDFEDRDRLIFHLDLALVLFQQRNDVIHGRIYANFERQDTLRSGRKNVPDRFINAAELYELAEKFNTIRGEILRPMIFELPRALAKR